MRGISGYLRRHHLGLIAIFIALSGSAVAATVAKNSVTSTSIKNSAVKLKDLAPNSVEGSKVVDDSLTGADILESTLNGIQGPPGERGPQGEQGPAGSPDTGQQILDKLAPVDGPGSGLDADTLDGTQASGFAGVGSEGLHVVGAAGEPPFELCKPALAWSAFGGIPPAFFRDPSGVVHLRGNAICAGTLGGVSVPTIFNLPPGYRPSAIQNHLVIEGNAVETNVITVSDSTGAVSMADIAGNPVGNGVFVVLDGITFRCGPSGANGCP